MQNKIEQKMKLKTKTQTMASFEYGCLYQMHTICRKRHNQHLFGLALSLLPQRDSGRDKDKERDIGTALFSKLTAMKSYHGHSETNCVYFILFYHFILNFEFFAFSFTLVEYFGSNFVCIFR